MKIAILSRAPRAYSTQRLTTAARERGHTVRVLNTLRFAIDLSSQEPNLQYRGKQLSHYDAVLPRIRGKRQVSGLRRHRVLAELRGGSLRIF